MKKEKEYYFQFKFDKEKEDYVFDKIFYCNEKGRKCYVKSANGYKIGDIMPEEFQNV